MLLPLPAAAARCAVAASLGLLACMYMHSPSPVSFNHVDPK